MVAETIFAVLVLLVVVALATHAIAQHRHAGRLQSVTENGIDEAGFVPIGGINAPAGAKNANANLGKIFNALDPRVIQFGIKLLF